MIKRIKAKFGKLFYLLKKAIYFAWYRHHFLIPPKALIKYTKSFFRVLRRSGGNMSNLYYDHKAYHKWIKDNEKILTYKKFKYNPLLSIIIPVYNVEENLLRECLDSCLAQTYAHFEVCIADDHSTNGNVKDVLEEYKEKDKRFKVVYRNKNGMISEASNSAIKVAQGEFVLFLDADDVLAKDALYYLVEVLNKNKKMDIIYSDEDKLDINGKRCEPHFKPDWSPDTIMSINYVCHLMMLRKSLVDEVEGFRREFDGAQDYDLLLRVVEKTNAIFHVPKILYHWRQSPNSTSICLDNKSYIKDAAIDVLNEALKRRNLKGEVIHCPNFSGYLVNYEHNNPLVSIILLTKNHGEMLNSCLEGLYNDTAYKNFEVILIDNGSTEKRTLEVIKSYQQKYKNFKVKVIDGEFNYSYLNNEGAKLSKGEYLLTLNDDTKVIHRDWLDKMVGYASLNHVGAVGIKLLYKNRKVQHAGVVLGYGGIAGHVYVTANEKESGDFGRLAIPYNYSAVTAACLLVSKKKFMEVGGFDEQLKVACNDVDLCLKLMQKGYSNVLLPQVTMFHYEAVTRGYEKNSTEYKRLLKEQEYMRNKWGKVLESDKYFSNNLY